jgi:peroxiredoxin
MSSRAKFQSTLVSVVLACLLCLSANAGEQAAGIAVKTPEGAVTHPFGNTADRVVVCYFITTDCPITNAFAPEMERICNTYKRKGVQFYAVYVDPTITAKAAEKHAHDFGLTCALLYDVEHRLVKFAGATITPEAAVFRSNGILAYRGRIDDRYLDFGKARYKPTTHELRNAIDAVLSNKTVSPARTRAVGCYISSGG